MIRMLAIALVTLLPACDPPPKRIQAGGYYLECMKLNRNRLYCDIDTFNHCDTSDCWATPRRKS